MRSCSYAVPFASSLLPDHTVSLLIQVPTTLHKQSAHTWDRRSQTGPERSYKTGSANYLEKVRSCDFPILHSSLKDSWLSRLY